MTKNERLRLTAGLLFFCVFLSLLSACAQPAEEETLRREWVGPFDTSSRLLAQGLSPEAFQEAGDYVERELKRLNDIFDIYAVKPAEGSVAFLNAKAGEGPQAINADLMEVLKLSQAMEKASGGAFNPCLGPVLALWHEAREASLSDPEQAWIPEESALREAAAFCQADGLVLYPESGKAELKAKGMRLDLGAVAKGYALEQIIQGLEAQGFLHLLIAMGGSIRALGGKGSGSPWMIGIQNPKGDDLPNVDILPMTGGSLTTSGVYERFFTVEGKTYHHIIDPKTLYPSAAYASISVTAGDSGLVDALSTALFNMNIEEGKALCDRYQAGALWITPSMEMTSNARWEENHSSGDDNAKH